MIPFAKVQSVGNDFVLVDLSDVPSLNLGELAVRLCARHFSVGSDGLLTVERLDSARFRMRMFNPDGTEDFCGNGLRCASAYAFSEGWVGESHIVEHGGIEIPTLVKAGMAIETVIGKASFEPSRVPHLHPAELFRTPVEVAGETLVLSALTTGSTHTILQLDELPDEERFVHLSQALEHHPLFPIRTSVIWVRQDSESDLRLRIWERGVGETLGCGTGSSAAVATVARVLGRGGEFNVHNPGGTLQVRLDAWDAPIRIEGSAKVVFRGRA